MANRAGSSGIDATLFRQEGPWCTAFVDASLGTTAAQEAADALPDTVAQLLKSQQASAADIEAMRSAIRPAEGRPSPVSRFVAVTGGNVVLDELVQGVKTGTPLVDCREFPNLVPLARAHGGQFPYLVAEVGRDGGEVRLRHSAVSGVAEEYRVSGDREEAHHARRVPGRYEESKNQHQTTEIWRRNADEIARLVDEVARDTRARLVVLAGDTKARELVLSQLAEPTRALAVTLEQHTRTGGADAAAVEKDIEEKVAALLAEDIRELSERIANQANAPQRGAVIGFDEVVWALQQGQASTVVVAEFQDDRSLLALGGEPWLASEGADVEGAGALGSWPAPEVLLRAVAMTDASIRYVPAGVLPDGAGIAALLRWPKGSPA